MYCHNCGNKRSDGEKFCPKCGTAYTTTTSAHSAGATHHSAISNMNAIRGWLLTLAIFIWISVAANMLFLILLLGNAEYIEADLTFITLLLISHTLAGITSGVMISMRKKAAVYVVLLWLGLGVVASVVALVMYPDSNSFVGQLVSMVYAVGWGVYLFNSERVERTLTD